MNSHDQRKENSVLYLDSEVHPVPSVCYSATVTTMTPLAKLKEDEKRIQSVSKISWKKEVWAKWKTSIEWYFIQRNLHKVVAIWCSQWNSGFSSGTTDILYPKMDVDPGSSSELNNRIRCRCSSHGLGSVLDGVASSWG